MVQQEEHLLLQARPALVVQSFGRGRVGALLLGSANSSGENRVALSSAGGTSAKAEAALE